MLPASPRRKGEIAGQHTFAVPHEVGDAWDEDLLWRTGSGADKDVLEAVGSDRRVALAGDTFTDRHSAGRAVSAAIARASSAGLKPNGPSPP